MYSTPLSHQRNKEDTAQPSQSTASNALCKACYLPTPFQQRAVSRLSLVPSSSENISDMPFSARFVSTIVRGWQTTATTTNRKKSVPKRILSYLAHEDVQQRFQVFIVTEVAAEGRRGLAASIHNLQQEQGR